jgi:hypothetical protein
VRVAAGINRKSVVSSVEQTFTTFETVLLTQELAVEARDTDVTVTSGDNP